MLLSISFLWFLILQWLCRTIGGWRVQGDYEDDKFETPSVDMIIPLSNYKQWQTFHLPKWLKSVITIQGRYENHLHPTQCKIQLKFIAVIHMQRRDWLPAVAQNWKNWQIVIEGFCLRNIIIWAQWQHFWFSSRASISFRILKDSLKQVEFRLLSHQSH
jgi:hypothetical protein